jgi:hypothetical protein
MNNKKQTKPLEEIKQELSNNSPQNYTFSKILSAQNNLLATLIAMGVEPNKAFKEAIHKYNPKYHNSKNKDITKDLKQYLENNPKVIDAIYEYKNNFIKHYTHSLQLNKEKILYEINKLHSIAMEKEELKIALECLKTIGSELGMFQKNIQIEHSYSPKQTVIEILDTNLNNIAKNEEISSEEYLDMG